MPAARFRRGSRPLPARLLGCAARGRAFRRRHGLARAASRCSPYRFAAVVEAAYRQRDRALRARLLPHARESTSTQKTAQRQAVPLFRVRRRGERSGGGRLHRRASHAARRYPGGCGRFGFAADRSRPDRRRLRAGAGLAHAGRTAVGCAGARRHRGRIHLQAAVVVASCRRCSTWIFWSAPPNPASSSAAKPSASRR